MRRNTNRTLCAGIGSLLAFALWTVLIQCVDVQAAGPNGTEIGFAALNTLFHRFSGVHMTLYAITDWLGLVPIGVCLGFGVLGLVQLIRRKSLRRVDADILLLGGYYMLVTAAYLIFETVPVNYRPILIEGRLEASYPSSTTLLVLSVMPTLMFQVGRRSKSAAVRGIAGVHWVTDIVGAVFLSLGLFFIYRYGVEILDRRGEKNHGIQ